jgi:teichuronic acid biosynthesis glycosyltransferase TuaC
MRVLIVCSKTSGKISPFIIEQTNALKKLGVDFDFYTINSKGIIGYITAYFGYIKKIWKSDYNLVHAHYGFSGLLASLQPFKPVITTFHGSDIDIPENQKWSKVAYKLSKAVIFVHKDSPAKITHDVNNLIIPCGVNTDIFFPLEQNEAKLKMNLNSKKKYILFASRFNEPVKNYALAEEAIKELNDSNLEVLELKNYTPQQVNLLMNTVNLLLVTSASETGPLVIKEAMATNCPFVSTDVGDVKQVMGNTQGCYIALFNKSDVAAKIKEALKYSEVYHKTEGRKRIIELGLESDKIADKVFNIYKETALQN